MGCVTLLRATRSRLRPPHSGSRLPQSCVQESVKTVEHSNYRREPCNPGKPEATASPQGGVGSSPRRDLWSAIQVNLIRPCHPASLRLIGEAEVRVQRTASGLTSHGNGVRWRMMGWLRAERREGVALD